MDRRTAEASFEHEALEAETVPELLASTAARHPDAVAQSYKGGVYDRSLVDCGAILPAPDGDYAEVTYSNLERLVGRLATGFREFGLAPDDRLLIVSHTRMEWTQVDLAAQAAGGVVTAAYPSSTDDRLDYLVEDAEPTGIVVENAALLRRVLGLESVVDPAFIVVMDRLPDGSGMAAAARDREDVHTVGSVYERGTTAFDSGDSEPWLAARDADDLASIIYTSGTTGDPKGVRLTHRNFVANVESTFRRFGPRPDRPAAVPHLDDTSRHLSVLPLAHVFERLVGSYLMVAAGVTVAYAESPETLAEDFRSVSPTCGTAVPRLYERLFERFETDAGDSLAGGRLFAWGVDVATRWHHTDDPGLRLRVAHRIADRLVYSRIREALGGQLELFISGGDSLSAELCAAYHGMGVPIFEGYGLTETAPVVSVNPPEAPKIGTIGPPLSGVETRLDTTVDVERSIEEASGEVGELLVRGENVTDGYWNDPASTADAFVSLSDADAASADGDAERWFRTGDIVKRRPDDYLVFRGRRKQLLVLSTGTNVAPDPIETAVCASPLIKQCLAVGDGRPSVAALVVPDVETVGRWVDREGVNLPADRDRVIEQRQVREWIDDEIAEVNERLEPHERIEAFALLAEPFSVDNGYLTPTLKKKRRAITERYADQIDRLY